MTKYAKDLHRKGELNKVEAMERLGKKLIKGKDMGLAFVTEGFYMGKEAGDVDGFGVIANKAEYQKYSGVVVYNELLNKPEFWRDDEE
jgi:hypothetical protein